MKSILLLFTFFTLGISLLKAQTYHYVPLVDSSYKIWVSRSVCDLGPYHFSGVSMFAMRGDTAFNGYMYKKIYLQDQAYYFALLETGDKKVYYRSSQDTSHNIGALLYDFGLNVNDSFDFNIVQSVDTILVADGTLRRRLFLSKGDVWVEGIGSIKYALKQMSVCGLQGALCWAKQDATLMYNDNNSYCDVLAIEDEPIHARVKVFPNPATDYFQVSFGSAVNNESTFYVYDIAGREILNHQLNSNNTVINAIGIQTGLYFWQVKNRQGVIAQGKLLKE